MPCSSVGWSEFLCRTTQSPCCFWSLIMSTRSIFLCVWTLVHMFAHASTLTLHWDCLFVCLLHWVHRHCTLSTSATGVTERLKWWTHGQLSLDLPPRGTLDLYSQSHLHTLTWLAMTHNHSVCFQAPSAVGNYVHGVSQRWQGQVWEGERCWQKEKMMRRIKKSVK